MPSQSDWESRAAVHISTAVQQMAAVMDLCRENGERTARSLGIAVAGLEDLRELFDGEATS